EFQQNLTEWSGRKYQSYIHSGYSSGKNFISVSKKTQEDLHEFLTFQPFISEVVYNGLNKTYVQMNVATARREVERQTGISLANGYLMHLGGNQWYKYRFGVIALYNAYRTFHNTAIPLLLIGADPGPLIMEAKEQSPYKDDIYVLPGKDDEFVKIAYAGASLFLFPSLAEGFGWPIAEAMALGCPVITTDEAPMSEVAGEAGFLIPKMPYEKTGIGQWARDAAIVINKILNFSNEEREEIIQYGLENVKRFDLEKSIDGIEEIYRKIIIDCTPLMI
ncbi:MAG: mannosyltransferase, partial [Mucilaginibacter sp.]|nr:mannosyltransferase [Mucilaginibacter sp.]